MFRCKCIVACITQHLNTMHSWCPRSSAGLCLQMVARAFLRWRQCLASTASVAKDHLYAAVQRAFAHRLLAWAVHRWRFAADLAADQQARAQRLWAKHSVSRSQRLLAAWQHLCQRHRHARSIAAQAYAARQSSAMACAWQAWRQRAVHAKSIAKAVTLASNAVKRTRVHACLTAWHSVVQLARSKSQQAALHAKHRQVRLSSLYFDRWVLATSASRILQHQAQLLAQRKKQSTLSLHFWRWRQVTQMLRLEQQQAVRAIACWLRRQLQRAMQAWHSALVAARERTQIANAAAAARTTSFKTKALAGWRAAAGTQHHVRRLQQGAHLVTHMLDVCQGSQL